MKAIRASPTVQHKPSASSSSSSRPGPIYTVPVISDAYTVGTISNSSDIASYLETTYPPPKRPSIFPREAPYEDVMEFQKEWSAKVTMNAAPLLFEGTMKGLSERSREYYLDAKREQFGKSIEELTPRGSERERQWESVREAIRELVERANTGKKLQGGGPWIMGGKLSYADAVVVAFLQWVLKAAEVDEWKEMARCDGGRWGELMDATEKYRLVG